MKNELLSLRKVEEILYAKIKDAKAKKCTAIEIFDIYNRLLLLLTPDEERVLHKCLSNFVKCKEIDDFHMPGDFHFKNTGILIIF